MAAMFDNLFGHTSIPLLSRAAQFTQARHQTILSNIANATTPGYRAQEIREAEFEEQLREAVERGGATPLRSTEHQRVGADGRIEFQPAAAPGLPGPDGNTVNLEHEIVALIRNTMRHNVTMELMRKQFSLIDVAIRERV
jgi:flagellar basal-body rod protein FlgB